MTIEDIPNSGDGLFYSRAWAEHAAAEMRAEGRITKIEESTLHPGQWVLYATPKPELPEDTSSTPVEDPIESAPAELQTKSADFTDLSTHRSLAEAESAALQLQAEGRQTRIEPSQLHANGWVVYATRLPR